MNKQIFYNGKIISMDNHKEYEAFIIENKIITACGNNKDILSMKDESTKIVDLNGQVVIPAFVDAHSHIASFAKSLRYVNLGQAKSIEDITKLLKPYVANDNSWIIGVGYDNNNFPGELHPNKFDLDKITSKQPIVISHISGHLAVVNSKTLEFANITNNTKDPDGGKIIKLKDSNEPSGLLEENAFMNLQALIPEPDINKEVEFLIKAQNIYIKNGYLTAQNSKTNESEFNILKLANKTNKLLIDTICFVDMIENKNIVDDNKKYHNYQNRLKIGGYKLFLDGSPQGRTSWMLAPYLGDDKYYGYPILKNQELYNFIKMALNEKKQLQAHCNGDAASNQFITQIEKYNKEYKTKENMRSVIIHSQFITESQIKKAKKLNLISSFFTNHIWYWGDDHKRNFGLDRASKICMIKTAIKHKLKYTIHQDTPVIYPLSFESIWCAVNRIVEDGTTLGATEAISPYEALEAITINSAYQSFEEKQKGSIEITKNADFLVIDKNPLTCNPKDLRNIKILSVYQGGIKIN